MNYNSDVFSKMTKSELIRNIASKIGIPVYQAVDFMELFLEYIREHIEGGKSLFIDELGEFRPVHVNISGKLSVSNYVEAILFEGKEPFTASRHLFDLPSAEAAVESKADNLMNLSFDKPVIPLESAGDTEAFLLLNGNQSREFLEQKAEELFTSGTIIDINSIEAYLSVSDLKEILNQKDSEKDIWRAIEESDPDSGEPADSMDWEFGAEWKKEVESEDILSEADLTEWNFGGEEAPAESGPDISFDDLARTNLDITQDEKEFVPVSSRTRELQIDLSELEDEETLNQKDIFLPPDPTSFTPQNDLDSLFKKSIAENFLFAIPDPIEKKEEERRKAREAAREAEEKAYLENEYSLRKRLESEGENDEESGELADVINLKPKFNKEDEYSGFDPRSLIKTQLPKLAKQKKPIIWTLLSVIFVAAVGITLYIHRFGVPDFIAEYLPKSTGFELPPIVATVIERDYVIPITYPYKKALSPADIPMLGIDSIAVLPVQIQSTQSVKPDSVVTIKREENQVVTPAEKPVVTEQKPPASTEQKAPVISQKPETPASGSVLVKGNIFREGDNYTVQVSSWRDKAVADKEAARLERLGHPAYVQSASIPGRGKWYRVRVGEFKTLQEAEDYSNKLK
ncbi:MAG: SPOR domain-containing protein [Ignavibacteriaceae bacterium]|nr:SPOR domain-containing protein [Ignavibacteriaceae bacterium]